MRYPDIRWALAALLAAGCGEEVTTPAQPTRELAYAPFVQGYVGTGRELFTRAADGTGRPRIPLADLREESVAWSPDGRRLVCRCYPLRDLSGSLALTTGTGPGTRL